MSRAPSCIIITLLTYLVMTIHSVAESPNFVVILTDDQSWVGSSLEIIPGDEHTKSDYYRTPHIERLASTGIRFTQGYSPAPFCCPTRRSILIGQTPARHIYQKDQRNWTVNYRKQLSIPQMLKSANPDYRAAHFGKWDFRFDDVTPEEMGYDISDGVTTNGTGGGKGSGGPSPQEDPKLIWGITERASEFMETQSQAGHPFYLQVSHYAVHLDIFYREQTLKKTSNWRKGQKHSMPEFAAMTSDVDTGIGLLIDKIDSLGLTDSTYIFFLSDNGGRNGIPGQDDPEVHRNDPLREGKGTVYEGGVRVPFIISGPGVDKNAISDVVVTGLDILPTLAELAGYKKALPKALDGGSLSPMIHNGGRGKVQRNNPFFIFHQAVARDAETSLILGDYKLVKTWDRDRLELFDISKDIGESKDLSKKNPKKAEELHRHMVNFLKEVGAETRKVGSKAEVYENAKPL
ncbi:sulfatase-like hydrolase/transferase [Opitutia bacterium ISCC 51]|nr:sulfatase-like hydrolase/transferase [Opitutae bacterium ISCC 51]QXD30258.1 sulfatase-like hydrolase/transferase [Opitutae bacterium ISCC 52]